ncbi:hypothetical protein NFI96_026550 [Prochilodus magdalenae]|nr:hypothetical protein NFI96_026550 [Prochilodus magdalenae]
MQVVRVSPRRWLNLQEYQSKKLMQDSGVTVQRFFVADTAGEALEAAKRLILQLTWVSNTTSTMVRYLVQLLKDGTSICAIATRFALSPSTVLRVRWRFQETGSYSRRAGQGYRRFLTPHQTISNRPHEGGLRARHPVVGPVLTAQHRRARLAFATEHQNWQIRHRRLVLSTDESSFYLSTCDRRDRLWRCRGECYAAYNIIQHDWFGGGAEYRVYSREQLLALRPMGRSGVVQTIPAELRRKYRGCRAGAKLKAKKTEKRWRYKPSVPSVVMGNVNSLTNKTDELACLVKNQRLYRECSLFCFTETWLTPDTPDANVELPGFSTVRADRDPTLSGKRKGGGLALFINTRWCNPGHVNVKEVICCRDIEMLAVSLRPYYMPRELSHAIVVCVYIPPRAEVQAACDVIHSTVAALQTQHPDAFYEKNRTIDLLYANVRDAYRATPLPPLGKSDHNLVFLQPQYKPLVLRQPTTTRSFRVWSPEAEEALKDCYDTTDWSVLLHPHGEDIEEVTHCVTDYLNFCMDVAVPTKDCTLLPKQQALDYQ